MFDALRNLLTRWFGPPAESGISRSTVKIDEIHPEITESIDSHPVPYDETLLERARTQWQFGDWQSLAQLNRDTLQHHPDRGKLALLAAAGRLQTGNNTEEARQLIRLAQDCGIGKKLISQILIAGVHNSIGRGAALGNQQQRALEHFECAISIGTPGSAKEFDANARARQELDTLGLLPGSQGRLQRYQIELAPHSFGPLASEKTPSLIKINESALEAYALNMPREDFVNEHFDVPNRTPTTNVLVIFSTPRSGSTLLCDVLRNNNACIPHEYFQPFQYLPMLAKRWGCIEKGSLMMEKYIKCLCDYRTFPNGWLGINLHGAHVPVFISMHKQFGNLRFRYIHLVRRDILGQSISFNLAVQTGLWTNFFQPIEKKIVPVFSFEAIESARKDIEAQNRMIRSYVETQKVDCREVFYEDLLSNWDENGRMLSSIFGIDAPFVFKTNLTKQKNQFAAEWRDLYNEELFKRETEKEIGALQLFSKSMGKYSLVK